MVASTRVRSREDVLILRPFPLWLYQRPASEGPRLLLKHLRGEAIDWAVYRDAKRPCAACEKCQQVLPLDAFEQKQWEFVRSNKLAICVTCKTGRDRMHRGKLQADSLQRFECMGCRSMKIADAFPRAQLEQPKAETMRQCLKCVQTQRAEGMQCRKCLETKLPESFDPSMVTMPLAGILCTACSAALGKQSARQRTGFFNCRVCQKTFPNAVAVGKEQGQNCLNCASRAPKQQGVQTCRNARCKRKWTEELPQTGKRQRYCPCCRRS